MTKERSNFNFVHRWIFIRIVFLQVVMCSISFGQEVEICYNAIDDDRDGLIDLNDPECHCIVFEPISKVPNPSFEESDCCPTSRSQLYCATGWIQASQATTDLIDDCGWPGWPNFPPPKPFPDGEAIVGFRDGRAADNSGNIDYSWKEYAGACLNSPLYTGEVYRFEFYIGFVNTIVSPSFNVTLFGTTSCEYLPFGVGDEEFGCPTNSPNWQELGKVQVGWNRGWVKSAIEITPKEDYYAIAIGPPCNNTSANTSTYYYFDNLVLDEQENFDWVISSDGHPCNDSYRLKVNEINGYTYQWYREGVALPGEVSSRISPDMEGVYQVVVENAEGCRTSGNFNFVIPVIEAESEIILCAGDKYTFGSQSIEQGGDYFETFTSLYGCDSTVHLIVEERAEKFETTEVKIFKGDKYKIENQEFGDEGSYDIIIRDSLGCKINLNLILEYYDVYWPNVFTPNGDGHNDYFNIHGGGELREVKELTIFSRWGGVLFHKNAVVPNEIDGWDGKSNKGFVKPGVYVFRALVVMANGVEKAIFDSIMVM